VALKWLSASSPGLFDTQLVRQAATKTPAAAPDFFEKYMDVDNMIRRSFIEIEKKYQKFFDARRNIEIPLDGNEAKIKKYHTQISKLRKQCEIPDKVEVMEMLVAERKACSKGNVRKLIQDLEETWGEALFESMMRIIGEVENEAGTPLRLPTDSEPSPPGWSLFEQKYQDLMKEYGLEKPLTKEQILYEDTKYGLERTVEHAQHSMDDLCEKLGICGKFDARELKITISRDLE